VKWTVAVGAEGEYDAGGSTSGLGLDTKISSAIEYVKHHHHLRLFAFQTGLPRGGAIVLGSFFAPARLELPVPLR
jgi:hypothetical protein